MGLALLLRPARPVVCDRLGNRTAPYDSARPIRFAEVVIDGDSFFIGRSLYAADAYLNASIDEFRIYDSALSARAGEEGLLCRTEPGSVDMARFHTAKPAYR
jgi:hypothetical protein